jgi:hypothetical protein
MSPHVFSTDMFVLKQTRLRCSECSHGHGHHFQGQKRHPVEGLPSYGLFSYNFLSPVPYCRPLFRVELCLTLVLLVLTHADKIPCVFPAYFWRLAPGKAMQKCPKIPLYMHIAVPTPKSHIHTCTRSLAQLSRQVGDSGERSGGAASGRDKEKARLKAKIEQKQKELKQKEGHLKELVNQFVSLKQLLCRNQRPEYAAESDKHHRIYLPFVIGWFSLTRDSVYFVCTYGHVSCVVCVMRVCSGVHARMCTVNCTCETVCPE